MTFRVSGLPRCAVMGILNVTPDSFSDGGRFDSVDAAVAHGEALAAAGASIVDVGGESTRPGAEPVDESTERGRVLPVVEQLVGSLAGQGVVISVDTTKAAVAEAALAAGATLVNDVSAATLDDDMLAVVAAHDAGIVLMHMQGKPRTMQEHPHYDDVVAEVSDYLAARVAAAHDAGVQPEAVLADPGIGFGKTMVHNLTLLQHLDEVHARARAPIAVGASRKRFLGAIVGEGTSRATASQPLPERVRGAREGLPARERSEREASVDINHQARDDATLATTVHAFARGARVVRVHDVAPSVHAAGLQELIADADAFGAVR